MTIAQNSVILMFLSRCWEGSTLRALLAAVQNWFLRQARSSVLCRFLWREGAISRGWSHSLLCRLLTGLINLPCTLARWLLHAGERIWSTSLFCRFLAVLGGGTSVFLGLFMMGLLMAPHERWNNLYGLVAAILLFTVFVIGSASRPGNRLETDQLGPYMVFYGAFICLAAVGSLSFSLSLRFFFFHMTCFLLVLLVVSSVHRYEQLQLMISLAVLGLSLAALYGCYQGVIGVEIVPSQQDMAVNVGMPGRVYSVFNNPNNFAEQLVMLLPLDLALFLNSHWRGKLLSLASLCMGVAAIGFTYSRSGWIGLTLAVLVFLTLIDWRFVLVVLILGVAALPLLPETIYNRILTIGNKKDTSTRYRFEIYETTRALMRDHWIRGCGLGSDVMRRVFQTYPTMFDGSYPIHTHNNYLQMWGETGVFGVIAYLGALLWQVKHGVKAFCRTTDRRVRRLLAASVGAFCGIMLIGVAEYTWFYPRNMFSFWFLFGIIGACIKLAGLQPRAGTEE